MVIRVSKFKLSAVLLVYLGNIQEMPGHPTKEWHRNVEQTRKEGNINQQTVVFGAETAQIPD